MPEAFQDTADIWFFPPAKHSHWFAKVDWYLNWQLCKGLDYTGLHLPKEVVQVAEQYEVDIPAASPSPRGSPLLVAAHGRLPTSHVVVMHNPGALGEWLKDVAAVSAGLNAKRIRVFLPASVTQGMATSTWEKLNSLIPIQFITDTEII